MLLFGRIVEMIACGSFFEEKNQEMKINFIWLILFFFLLAFSLPSGADFRPNTILFYLFHTVVLVMKENYVVTYKLELKKTCILLSLLPGKILLTHSSTTTWLTFWSFSILGPWDTYTWLLVLSSIITWISDVRAEGVAYETEYNYSVWFTMWMHQIAHGYLTGICNIINNNESKLKNIRTDWLVLWHRLSQKSIWNGKKTQTKHLFLKSSYNYVGELSCSIIIHHDRIVASPRFEGTPEGHLVQLLLWQGQLWR